MTHYCDVCGEAVGRFTPYIPFVNIRFNYSIFATMWRGLWFGDGWSTWYRILFGFVIFLFAPILLLGLPFAIHEKLTTLRRYRRLQQGLCATCGYNLTGNESGVCPECGTKSECEPCE